MGENKRKRIIRDYATQIGLVLLSVVSVIITIVMAVHHSPRLLAMLIVSVLMLLLTAIHTVRVRVFFKVIHQRNWRLRRRVRARKGDIIHETGKAEMPETQHPDVEES